MRSLLLSMTPPPAVFSSRATEGSHRGLLILGLLHLGASERTEAILTMTRHSMRYRQSTRHLGTCTRHPSSCSFLPQSALLQKGVACETRQLPVGDMLWVARCNDAHAPEVVLGYIVERKTATDLASSIIDGR